MATITDAMIAQNQSRAAYLANMAGMVDSMAQAQHQMAMDQIKAEKALYELQKDKKFTDLQLELHEMKMKIARREATSRDIERAGKILDKLVGESYGALFRLYKEAELNPQLADLLVGETTKTSPQARAQLGSTEEFKQKKKLARSKLINIGLSDEKVDKLSRIMSKMQDMGDNIAQMGTPAQMEEMSKLAREARNIVAPVEKKLEGEVKTEMIGSSTRRGLLRQMQLISQLEQASHTGSQGGVNERQAARDNIVETLGRMFGSGYRERMGKMTAQSVSTDPMVNAMKNIAGFSLGRPGVVPSGPTQTLGRAVGAGLSNIGRGIGEAFGRQPLPTGSPELIDQIVAARQAQEAATPMERAQLQGQALPTKFEMLRSQFGNIMSRR